MSFWILTLGTANAATLEVGPDAPFRDLPSAIEQARDGDRIEVHPGSYTGPVRLGDKVLEIVSTGGSAVTTILPVVYDGYSQTVVDITGSARTTLRGFTLDGQGESLVMYVGDGNLVAEDLRFSGGPDRNLVVETSDVSFTDCAFTGALGSNGGHAQLYESTATFERVSFSKGHASWAGGALYLVGTDATFDACTFADNEASDGGALKIEAGDGSTVTITDSVFERNEALSGYAGAISQYRGTLALIRTTFRENTAHRGSGVLDHTEGTLFRLEDSRVEGNHTSESTSGIGLYGVLESRILRTTFERNDTPGDGAALAILGSSETAEIAGNRFCGNVAGGIGGAIWLDTSETLHADIHHNVFIENEARYAGGAIAVTGAVADLVQNTLVGTSTGGGRGAVWLNSYGRLSLRDTAITHSVGAALSKEPDAPQIDAAYTLLSDNERDFVEMPSSPTTVETSPGYAAWTPGDCGSDLRPAPGSALVDAGDPALLDDDGTRADIGAYGGPEAIRWVDVDGDGVIDGDCDPWNPMASTPADEIAGDGLDQDCDGTDLCWIDGDGDGVGGSETAAAAFGCAGPGLTTTAGDCDDDDPERAADCGPAPAGDPDETAASALPARWFCDSTGGSPWAALLWVPAVLVLRSRRASR